MTRARASLSLVCTFTTATEHAPTCGLTLSGKPTRSMRANSSPGRHEFGRCEPVIVKETVGQILVIGDPHDVWIADDDVGFEPLLPARADLGEKEELETVPGMTASGRSRSRMFSKAASSKGPPRGGSGRRPR